MSEINGNRIEINRVCLPQAGKLGEIAHPTRHTILFQEACLPQVGEAEFISILFPFLISRSLPVADRRSGVYIYRISIVFLLHSSSHSYSFLLQIGFQLRNSYFLEVEDTCR
jgi:hypothetical protein